MFKNLWESSNIEASFQELLMRLIDTKLYLPLIITILFFTLMINYFDRSAIAYAISQIQQEFQLNNLEFGALGAAFGFGYLFMTVVGGMLVDKFKAHKVLSGSAALWSILSILIGIVTGYWLFYALRVLLGVTEGPCFPAVTRVIADWLPMTNRVKIMACTLVAVPLASALGAPLMAYLINHFSWRGTYIILGFAGLIFAVLWALFYRDKTELSTPVQDKTNKSDWKKVLFTPALLANNFAYFSYGYLLFFALLWLPGYLEQSYGLKLHQIGWFLTIPWLCAAIFLLAGGFISDKLFAKTQSIRIARSHIIWISQLLSALCFIPVILSPHLTTALIFISLGLGFGFMSNSIFYSLNIDLAKEHAATSLGIMDWFFGLAGIIAPWLTGYLSKITHNFNSAIFMMIVFTLCGVVGIIVFQRESLVKPPYS